MKTFETWFLLKKYIEKIQIKVQVSIQPLSNSKFRNKIKLGPKKPFDY
jgi:hypothetical protein